MAIGAALVPDTVLCQSAGPESGVTEQVQVLQAERDFAGAARLLAPYVREHPEDADSWLALARNLYWAGMVAGARSEFERAIALHPRHVELRLAYGRLLVDLNEAEAARRVLDPLREHPDATAEAERLLGTLAYWRGDLSAAKRHFRRTLQLNGEDQKALRQLNEIRDQSRPWLKVQGGLQADTQPINGQGLSAETGLFLTPLQTISAHVSSRRFSAADSMPTVEAAGLVYKAYWPALRLDTELAGGLVLRSTVDDPDWTGRVALGARLPHRFAFTAAVERAAYLYTEASLFEPVTTEALSGLLTWAPPNGWMAEAGARLTSFPDDNLQRDVFAWVLAPLVTSSWVGVQGGYAFSYQHADASRFTAVLEGPPQPGQPPQFEGRYVPYYTPNRLQAHGISWAIQLRPQEGLSVRAGGNYGFFAVEQAPYVYTPRPGGPPLSGFYENRFNPWEARGTLQLRVAPILTGEVEASHMRTAYYDATQVGLTLLYRIP